MKFSERSAAERTAIDGWIRVSVLVRENEYLPVSDDFRQERRKTISEQPGDIGKMLRCYAAYQLARPSASYTQYFQVSHPEEYAAILLYEGTQPSPFMGPANSPAK